MSDRAGFCMAAVGSVLLGIFWVGPAFWKSDPLQDLELSAERLEFGTVSVEDYATRELVLTNQGRVPLKFLFGYECSCTHCLPASGEIAPGATQAVEVSYFPKSGNESFIPQETELDLRIRNFRVERSQRIGLSAVGYRPILANSDDQQLKVAALRKSEFQINLTLQSDVTQVQLIDVPSFLSNVVLSEIDPRFSVATISGNIDELGKTQVLEGELSFEVKHRTREGSHNFGLPIVVNVEPPFRASSSILTLAEQGEAALAFTPCAFLDDFRVLPATDLDERLQVRLAGNTALVRLKEDAISADTDASTMCLDLLVDCAAGKRQNRFPVSVPVYVLGE